MLLVPEHTKAQYYELPDSVIIENKNSLGFYVSPVAAFMLNSFAYSPRFGLQYKRWLTDYKRLRLSLVHDFIEYDFGNNDFDESRFVQSTGSTLWMLSESRMQRKTTLRAGMEWTDYSSKIDSYFGFDIIAGYKSDEYDTYYKAYDYYTSTNSTDTADYVVANTSMDKRPYSYYYQYLEFGIAPIIGWRFDIKKRFEFTINASPELSVAIPIAQEWRGEMPMPIESRADTEIEFRLRLLEMVLSYRF